MQQIVQPRQGAAYSLSLYRLSRLVPQDSPLYGNLQGRQMSGRIGPVVIKGFSPFHTRISYE
jgi:hypothetical protein